MALFKSILASLFIISVHHARLEVVVPDQEVQQLLAVAPLLNLPDRLGGAQDLHHGICLGLQLHELLPGLCLKLSLRLDNSNLDHSHLPGLTEESIPFVNIENHKTKRESPLKLSAKVEKFKIQKNKLLKSVKKIIYNHGCGTLQINRNWI